MNDILTALIVAAATITVVIVVTWVVSLRLRNASIIDIVWGFGFVAVAWAVWLTTDGDSARRAVLLALTTAWGLRLTVHLAVRNHGAGEDFRYRAMRKHYGDRFALVSLTRVYAFQALVMWIVSLSVQLGMTSGKPGLGIVAWIGIVLWAVGFAFESIGDWQLARFMADPANSGQVMDRGLWRYTRHPNYFGDACVWWGISLVAAETVRGLPGLIGAAVMTYLLVRVSGVPMLEKSMSKRRPGYDAYVARTSSFFPRPPRG